MGIERLDLYAKLGNVKKQKQWERMVARLSITYSPEKDLCFSYEYGKGSHAVIYDAKYPMSDIHRWRISTVQSHLRKDVNEAIFKQLLRHGIQEADIWKAFEWM